ncbi:hypothetical protein ACU6T4_08080 [Avibacterium paragallinarum]|uniref:hypothetical protein n=1 Tax=Avibacterium paragallinarum TaxID=728 RepID=UPI000551C110|nr:hypothetical protein [Avibacterium paragallinarum]AZI14012.1 hypothetical protein EIA51_04880 [Avibacterium paragallinarum]QIR11477.1 hypothetical protein HBL79_04025 [Avibacterium paragallinarum]QJE09550.1 hypothetical protein HHJ62_04125 [Avibacterium paragallinarum]QJE11745.1 hypothetical protein HHJ61_04125 [Avibacterium paragallinarum]QJE13944.1 hypothetical protein HHJ60_04135 [Avibacterium paragallinarum]
MNKKYEFAIKAQMTMKNNSSYSSITTYKVVANNVREAKNIFKAERETAHTSYKIISCVKSNEVTSLNLGKYLQNGIASAGILAAGGVILSKLLSKK